MTLRRTHWGDLSENLRSVIQEQTGPVLNAQAVLKGLNSEIAEVLLTSTGKVFIKGLRSDHPRVWTQKMESMINPYVVQIGPRLWWHIDGRHADYSRGSMDIPKVIEAIRLLGQVQCPDLPLKRAEQRWAPYMEDTSALRGDTLLHTDFNPLNVLINGTARIIDWAWPTRGAAWIEPACFILRLMAAGHTPEDAETWAQQTHSWPATPKPSPTRCRR